MRRDRAFWLAVPLVTGMLGVLFLTGLALWGGEAGMGVDSLRFACAARLKHLYLAIEAYKHTHGGELPAGGGTEFLYNLWVSLERTPANRDLFFCPEIETADENIQALKKAPIDDIWKTRQDFNSTSTHYAARAAQHRHTMLSGREVWIADDHEHGMNHRDGSTSVLWGSGEITVLCKQDLIEDGRWPADDPAFVLKVGPGSTVAELTKLDPK